MIGKPLRVEAVRDPSATAETTFSTRTAPPRHGIELVRAGVEPRRRDARPATAPAVTNDVDQKPIRHRHGPRAARAPVGSR